MAYKKFTEFLENTFVNGKVAIYVRVSTDHQVDKDSLPTQKKDLINYCKLILGIEDYEIFEDAGFSGKNTKRPGYQEMMDRIRNGEFTHLLVWKLDRISRNLIDFAMMYEELQKNNVVFASKNEQFDTSTAMGKAMLRIILVFAEMEREITSERVSAIMISRAAEGKWNGGRVPYAYDYDSKENNFSIIPEEKELVLQMYDMVKNGTSLMSVCNALNTAGHRTRNDNMWTPTAISKIIHNVWYYGAYAYNQTSQGQGWKAKDKDEWIIIENHHEPIIDKSLHDDCCELLHYKKTTQNTSLQAYTTDFAHIFQGKVFCMQCGSKMYCNKGKLRVSGWIGSRYLCPTKRLNSSDCKNTSDAIVGDLVINFMLNMMNAYKDTDYILSEDALEQRLIAGAAFNNVSSIVEGVSELYHNIMHGSLDENQFTTPIAKTKQAQSADIESEIRDLREAELKIERAMQRLRNLYLYEEDSMPEKDYIIERNILINQLEEVQKQIEQLEKENKDFEQSISDSELIQIATRYILSQKLNGRDYVDFESLCTYTDRDILKLFIESTVSRIDMDYGLIRSITYQNGLRFAFKYKSEDK